MKLTSTILALALLASGAGAQPDAAVLAANQSLLWGTWRPNLYFGLRARGPPSLLTGIMWFGVNDYKSYTQVRHACEQGDGLQSYTFTEHDGRSAAVEIIKDVDNNLEMRIQFLKVPGGDKGGSWAYRIQGRPLDESLPARISLMQYYGNDGGLGNMELQGDEDEEGIEGDVEMNGDLPGLGQFKIGIQNDPTNSPLTEGRHVDDFGDRLHRTSYYAGPVAAGNVWQAKNLLMNTFMPGVQAVVDRYPDNAPDPALLFALPNEVRSGANLFAFQKTYEGVWSVDVFYDSVSVPGKLDTPSLSAGLMASSAAYLDRFSRTFALATTFSESHLSFARDITANLIGGIGYFYGSSIVDRNFAHEWDDDDMVAGEGGRDAKPELTDPQQLFTATPSRSFFPRGFYWDEGFHLLVVGAWDNDLSLEILKNWVDLIDEDGWVAREQILGEEARSKVPKEFQTQYPTYANPPTLAMAVTAYIDRLKAAGVSLASIDPSAPRDHSHDITSAESLSSLHVNDPYLAQEFLTSIYEKLKRHYEWFRETQRGQLREWGREAHSRTEAYRWRGRTADHVLTSGLDDYPRAKPPHLGELHLDLISWMGFFTKTMSEIAEFLGEEDDRVEFVGIYDDIVANIEDLHWSEQQQMYCDASVDQNDESYHVCHKGYISLFPFLLGLLPPDSPHLGAILDLVRDPAHLWSPYGIRSLSPQDPFYGQGEDYWRGSIWIQMNYMALSSLYKIYAKEPGPNQVRAAQIYAELRTNVIENVHSEYVRTGYAWEQYDPRTGEGKRSHPFTGWTSLVTLIMAEQYA